MADSLYDFLARAQALGICSSGLSRRQRATAPSDYAAFVASFATIGRARAWLVAAVFAVHPLHVESVAWVIERKDLLSGLFCLAAVLAWMRFVEQPNSRRYAGSLVLYAAAMLSKSIAITLPAALLIWHWWKQGRVTSVDLLRIVPFCAVGLVIAVGDLSFYQSMEPLSLGYSFTERTLIAARALWFYASKLLWPTNLAVIYPLWDIRVADPLAWGYVIATVALAVALWHFRRQLGRGPLAGALFFAVTLSPVLASSITAICSLLLPPIAFSTWPASGYGRRHRCGHV